MRDLPAWCIVPRPTTLSHAPTETFIHAQNVLNESYIENVKHTFYVQYTFSASRTAF
jgi:hypothetical protein